MASDFHEVQFPTDISFGSIGGPEFSTEITELSSGHEQRNINWTYSRERWNVGYGIKHEDQLTALATFFYARKGRAIGFRFKNWGDYQGTAEEIGTGDDLETQFQLIKLYTSGGQTYSRRILKPVSGTVHIYFDGVEQGAGWTVDTTTGMVTFAVAPTTGTVITATYEFDVPVRFDTDYLPMNFEAYKARSADVTVLELKDCG